jgi:hypothetical protein
MNPLVRTPACSLAALFNVVLYSELDGVIEDGTKTSEFSSNHLL